MHIQSVWSKRSDKCSLLLLLFWLAGSVFGLFLIRFMAVDLVTEIGSLASTPKSVCGVLVADVLPFLIGGLAVWCSEPWVLPVLGGMKAFCFSYASGAVALSYGESSWLIHLLLLFSDIFLVPALCIFCLRYCSGRQKLFRREWCIWLLKFWTATLTSIR